MHGDGDRELSWRPGLPVFLSLQVPPPVTPRTSPGLMAPGCTHAPAPEQDVARRGLLSAWWARFTFHGITRCERGTCAMVGGEELASRKGLEKADGFTR